MSNTFYVKGTQFYHSSEVENQTALVLWFYHTLSMTIYAVERPNLGCRELVQRNVIKLAPALSNELSSWQADVRVRCSQLLCAIAQHAEDGVIQQLQGLLPAMYTAARDEDQRVVVNVRMNRSVFVFSQSLRWWFFQ